MEFVRKEWGAVTFVLTVIVGMIVVPVMLYLANQKAGPVSLPNTASGSRTASSVHTPSPSAPAASPTPTP